MTAPKPLDDNESRLADIFAEGFKRFRSAAEEEEAKTKATGDGDKGKTDDGNDKSPALSWTDRLLGIKPADK